MLNLVYKDTVDEKVYSALSKRMKDRFDVLGSLSQFTTRRKAANSFDLRYGSGTLVAEGPSWAQCETVLARGDVVERLSRGW